MEKSMLKAELSKEMRTSPTVHPSDCGNSEAPINYQQLLDFKTCSDWKLLEISPHYPSVVLPCDSAYFGILGYVANG
ncbi:hypothetical protein F383_07869 [Gossypium arboreum]|uniref:Uncharacterized protein n=1 Tax=Gossypium arboreum TaxID=29729 RepID=A0A0B0NPF9_GOSAR|nr:hypothetical protein F383_07869 [Gossypium arboreum]